MRFRSFAIAAFAISLAVAPVRGGEPEGTSGSEAAAAGVAGAGEAVPTAVAVAPESIANQASTPAAPLSQIQFRDVFLPNVSGTDGITNAFQIQPVIPVGPFHSLRFIQLVKVTLAFPSIPSPVGESGFGDIGLYDLVTVKQSWGRWGFGPALVFPTASEEALGQGKWQAGPAFAAIFTGRKNLVAGAVLQNPISFAGDSEQPEVNSLLIAPTLTFTLAHGWFAGLSDFEWTFDWTEGGDATIPLGAQVGKVVSIGKQPVSLSIEAGKTVTWPTGTPDPGWIFAVELTPIFKWHISDEKRVRVRVKK